MRETLGRRLDVRPPPERFARGAHCRSRWKGRRHSESKPGKAGQRGAARASDWAARRRAGGDIGADL
eukprot:9222810-Pyramimonas_sp.AAC.1